MLAFILLFILLAIGFTWASKKCYKLRDFLNSKVKKEEIYRAKLLDAIKSTQDLEQRIDIEDLREKKKALDTKLANREAILKELDIQ